jgi:hypothetical protein
MLAMDGILLAAALATTPPPPCASDARTQALKMLRFYTDDDDRAAIDPDSVRKIGTVSSLTDNRRYDVLQVYGEVYKGHYRMRLIYAHVQGECVLMGEEIFELANL